MKIVTVCLVAVLACSCRRGTDVSRVESQEDTAKRQEQVRLLISRFCRCGPEVEMRGPLTVEQVHEELVEAAEDLSRAEKRTLTFEGPEWHQLKSKLGKGDEFYFFKSDRQSWTNLEGSEGYIAIRGSEIIGSLVTIIN